MGGAWQLNNHSAELVPAGEARIPGGSAQLDLPHLQPQPRSQLPAGSLPFREGSMV